MDGGGEERLPEGEISYIILTCHILRETVPLLTSDMGKKTISVLAH